MLRSWVSSIPLTLRATHRLLSTATPHSLHGCRIPHRALYEFKGRDVMKYLQGCMTKNVQSLEECVMSQSFKQGQNAFYTSFLNPQGRVMADAFVHMIPTAQEPCVLIELDDTISEDLITFLRRFKLRSKFQINNVSSQWDVYQVWGKGPLDMTVLHTQPASYAFKDIRTPDMGWRVVVPKGRALPWENVATALDTDYTIHRISQGVPEGAQDIHMGSSLPLESCIDYMQGVDFHKGCYIGQELTARTFFTGLVRKRIMPVSFSTEPPQLSRSLEIDTCTNIQLPDPDADVRLKEPDSLGSNETSKPSRSRSAGKFLSGIHNIGLAILRFEHVDKAQNGEAEHPNLVTEAPDGTTLYLHAFRPSWWKQ